MTKDEALKLALEALIKKMSCDDDCKCSGQQAITAIKEALAQPEPDWTPERIAGMARLKEAQDKKLAHPKQEYHAVNAVHKGQQCYVKTQKEQDSGIVTDGGFDPRTQRTWVGLTKKEFQEAVEGLEDLEDCWVAIEAKLRSKNDSHR